MPEVSPRRQRHLHLLVALAVGASACSSDSSTADRGRTMGIAGSPGAGGALGDGAAGFDNGASMAGGAGGGAGAGPGLGAGGAVSLDECAGVREEAALGREGADIIWAIDNSCSMAAEAAAVQTNMEAFTQRLYDEGVDVRLILISSGNAGPAAANCQPDDFVCQLGNLGGGGFDFGVCIPAPFGSGNCPDDTNLPRYLHVPQTVGSHDALAQIIATHPQWQGQLRDNARKHFVVVTDDTAGEGGGFAGVGALTFPALADGLAGVPAGDWVFDGIFPYTACADAAGVDPGYARLVKDTGGVSGDLCTQDFGPVFDSLATGIAAASRIHCEWDIPDTAPDGQEVDPSRVNVLFTPTAGAERYLQANPGGCGAAGGWTYSADMGSVVLCPDTCTALQGQSGTIEVQFGCATRGPD